MISTKNENNNKGNKILFSRPENRPAGLGVLYQTFEALNMYYVSLTFLQSVNKLNEKGKKDVSKDVKNTLSIKIKLT